MMALRLKTLKQFQVSPYVKALAELIFNFSLDFFSREIKNDMDKKIKTLTLKTIFTHNMLGM